MFHVAIFVLIGPNFIRECLLLLFAANPLYVFRSEQDDQACETVASGTVGDSLEKFRAVFAASILVARFGTQFWSDYDHLTGKWPWTEHHNPYFPLPEMDVFVSPHVEYSNYWILGFLKTFCVLFLRCGMVWVWRSCESLHHECRAVVGRRSCLPHEGMMVSVS